MSVRMVLGRAGTGKTALCAGEIRAEMEREPVGGALLWIVPEQGTFEAERLLLTGRDGGRRGTFRAQVLSFRRLAMLIGREVGLLGGMGGDAVKPMDEVVRVVLLEEMVRRERGRLTVFGAVADRPGFIGKLDATLRELRQQGHTGATLRGMLDTPAGAGGAGMDAVTRRKLMDLGILLEAWEREVGAASASADGGWDFETLMRGVAEKVGASPLIAGHHGQGRARIWVDAISAMSGLEVRMLSALGKHAENVTVTLLADPDSPAVRQMRLSGEPGLFGRTERLYLWLVDAFRGAGVTMEGMVALREGERFLADGVRKVERMMDDDAGVPGEGAALERPGGVELWECSDPETEVRAAAELIRERALRREGEGGMRYRQMAVIVPDLEDETGDGYADAVRRIFLEHGIPHFIDARRHMGHHPVVELIRSALAAVRGGFERDDMLLLLKSQLLGVTGEEVSLLENYLIEHGIMRGEWGDAWTWVAPNESEEEGGERRGVPESARVRLLRVNQIRERVWGSLKGFVLECEKSDHFAGPLQRLMETLGVEKQIGDWIEAARAAGDAELAQVHEQVWREVQRLLATLENILNKSPRTLAEFERLTATALQSLTLGLIPPTVDQVLVSSVTRSRVPEMELVIILGAVEGRFPKVVSEDPILSDAQRQAFNAAAENPIGEGSDRELLEMPFFDYVALTRSRRELIVSRPLADRSGRALGESRHITRLREILGAGPGGVVVKNFDPASRLDVARMATVDDVLTGVARWARELETAEHEAANETAMRSVYNWVVTGGTKEMEEACRWVWPAIGPKRVPALSKRVAAWFYPESLPVAMSVSQLEKFAECPLQYFMQYTIGLKARKEFALDVMSLGSLQHRILETLYVRIMQDKIGAGPRWPNCSPADLRAALNEEVDRAILEMHGEIAQRMPGYDKTQARIKRILGVMVEADRRRALQGQYRPAGVEMFFGQGESPRERKGRIVSLPVLAVPAGDAGRHMVHVRGKIDRMNKAASGQPHATVIDYKSSAQKSVQLFRVYHGLAMQLPLYALVAQELAGQQTAAALYMNLGMRREMVERLTDAPEPETDLFYQQFQPRGVADAKFAGTLDRDLQPGEKQDSGTGKSLWYKMGFKADGEILKTSDLLRHDDFQSLLAFTRRKIAELAGELVGGRIAPVPYKVGTEMPCDRCEYVSLCPFDRTRDRAREVIKMGNDAVMQMMKGL